MTPTRSPTPPRPGPQQLTPPKPHHNPRNPTPRTVRVLRPLHWRSRRGQSRFNPAKTARNTTAPSTSRAPSGFLESRTPTPSAQNTDLDAFTALVVATPELPPCHAIHGATAVHAGVIAA